MLRKTSLFILITLSSGSILIQPALGAKYPTRPITIGCTTTPGSSMDLEARLVADIATKYLGQPMTVVNKAGIAGSIVAADVLSSPPDGYKLAQLTTFAFAATYKTLKLPFDPSHLIPIANFTEFRLGMFVRSDSPWKTINDLLDYAKNNPTKLRWAHTGRGQPNHVGGLLIFRSVGANTIEVPYKGPAEILPALLGGHLDAYCGPYGSVRDQVRTGLLRCLTVFSEQRYSEPSNVPCALELGFPGAAKMKTLVGVWVPKDAPEEVRKTLSDTFKKTYEDPAFKKGIENIGNEPRFGGPELIIKTIKETEEVCVPLIKELGLYVEQ